MPVHIHKVGERVTFVDNSGGLKSGTIQTGTLIQWLNHLGVSYAEVETDIGVYDVEEWRLMGIQEAMQ